ncbi:hypothetical protein NPS01_25270 [Nocardioides psychrotolerans]|uniref:DnaB-like helicase N terminal domain-containing protein n=2 Tax=Nocardioides psychrotolerans TaxID=1005945 RepID=A0A1I3LN67_9ACTN|nr:hypothetical protein NPS01_25270 [Nocardioides psychrotolerans]SFI85990.1 DnaB-like helicase N terminal domain-containing protein [Nocardioides psychrotolerans]
MAHPDTFPTVAKIVTGTDFYWPHHETLWRTVSHLHGAGQPTEAPAVIARLVDTGQLRPPLDGPLIYDLWSSAYDRPGIAEHYAHRVDQLARRRAAITLHERNLQKLRNPGPDTDVDEILNTTAAAFIQARDDLANPPTTTTWSPVDLEPVLAGEHLDPPPTMLRRTDGIALLYDGAVHTISGESESGKTWLTLIAAHQLLEDGKNVVFLDFEDRADRVIGRLMALGATPTQIRAHFAYIRPDRPLDDDGRAQLAPALAGVALVILDGVTEAMTTHGFDLNSNADSALFQAMLPRWLADHGPSVVMIDHVVKDKEKQDRFALGAQHKLAGIDGVAYIVKMIQPFARGKRGLAKVEIAKDRPGHVREHAFGRTIAEFTLDATISDVILTAHLMPPGENSGRTGDTFEPTHLMEKISRTVQLTPGLSRSALIEMVGGNKKALAAAFELLIARQYILAKTESRGRISHHHIKAYYQAEDTTHPAKDGALDDPEQEAS